MTVFNSARQVLAKRAQYLRAKHELESMSLRTAQDLGMFREDAAAVAHKAVYGN